MYGLKPKQQLGFDLIFCISVYRSETRTDVVFFCKTDLRPTNPPCDILGEMVGGEQVESCSGEVVGRNGKGVEHIAFVGI